MQSSRRPCPHGRRVNGTRSLGFTLVEIMIVVLIIGVLSAIAIPNWITARTKSQTQTCIANLKKIESAKEQWTMSNSKPEGSACTMADLNGTYLKTVARCPTSGTYDPKAVGQDPTCTIAGHRL